MQTDLDETKEWHLRTMQYTGNLTNIIKSAYVGLGWRVCNGDKHYVGKPRVNLTE